MRDGSTSSFDVRAKRLLQTHPHTPRKINTQLILSSIRNRLVSSSLIIGLLGILVGSLRLQRDETTWISSISSVFGLIGGVIFLLLPLYTVWYNRNALRYGRLGEAQVTEVYKKYAAMTASVYPLVTGEYRVSVDGETFSLRFKLNYHWSDRVEEGTIVPVLLHPSERKVLLELNPNLLEEDVI